MPIARDLKLMALAGALFFALGAGVWLGGLSEDVLLFAPVFVLLVPLLGGRYVGEEALGRLAAARVSRGRRRAPVALPAPVPRWSTAGSAFRDRLIAGAHGCLPPPASALT